MSLERRGRDGAKSEPRPGGLGNRNTASGAVTTRVYCAGRLVELVDRRCSRCGQPLPWVAA
jgi:hypothetical protein